MPELRYPKTTDWFQIVATNINDFTEDATLNQIMFLRHDAVQAMYFVGTELILETAFGRVTAKQGDGVTEQTLAVMNTLIIPTKLGWRPSSSISDRAYQLPVAFTMYNPVAGTGTDKYNGNTGASKSGAITPASVVAFSRTPASAQRSVVWLENGNLVIVSGTASTVRTSIAYTASESSTYGYSSSS